MSTSIQPIQVPYQSSFVEINQLPPLNGFAFRIREIAREIDPNLSTHIELGSKICLLKDTIVRKLPKEKADETQNKIIALIQIAAAVTLAAVTVFLGLSGSTVYCITAGVILGLVNLMNYVISSDDYAFVEKRITDGSPAGPWFCPNMDTNYGKFAAATLVWPLLAGFFTPLLETFSRVDRWEATLKTQVEQLGQSIQPLCDFYKAHAFDLFNKIQMKENSEREDDPYKKAAEDLFLQLDFLRQFDAAVPTKADLTDYNKRLSHALHNAPIPKRTE